MSATRHPGYHRRRELRLQDEEAQRAFERQQRTHLRTVHESAGELARLPDGQPGTPLHGEDIKAAIRKCGHTLASIAARCAVGGGREPTTSAVSRVVHGDLRSTRIAACISDVIGIPVAQLWPGMYAHDQSTVLDEIAAEGRAALSGLPYH